MNLVMEKVSPNSISKKTTGTDLLTQGELFYSKKVINLIKVFGTACLTMQDLTLFIERLEF